MTKIHAAFLEDPGARAIMAVLRAAGGEARFVGGCVRDALLGLDSDDVDLATTLPPDAALNAILAAGMKAKPLGGRHGVNFAFWHGRAYEIASLREDVQTDGRHAVVAYTTDWALDARRRDFTLNAFSCDMDGTVHDYVGGLADLEARRVGFIGDADARVREDYLRILRFYRFHARFGGAVMDDAARAACRRGLGGLPQLSRERVTQEMEKLLTVPNPLQAVDAMTADGVAPALLPACHDTRLLARLLEREALHGPTRWFVRLAAWASLTAKTVGDFLPQLTFMRADRKELQNLFAIDLQKPESALHHHGAAAVREAALLIADDGMLAAIMFAIANWQPCEFPLAAEDLLAAGIPAGPDLGDTLRAAENWWLQGGRTADHAACLGFVKMLMA
jgi:tRNA nucleotidyltransferase/poly(A) polymerase